MEKTPKQASLLEVSILNNEHTNKATPMLLNTNRIKYIYITYKILRTNYRKVCAIYLTARETLYAPKSEYYRLKEVLRPVQVLNKE